jgi:acyl-CoA synthetase (AMP-forming)/AMP-acid ligase II
MVADAWTMNLQPLDYPPTVPNLVRHAASAFPKNEYIVTADRRLTFADAEQQSRRLAKRLLRGGVAKGGAVGVLFPQGPDFVVALLAATRIGAIAVPLSTFLRGPELSRAIRHVDVDTLVAPATLLGRDTATMLEDLFPELRTATDAQLFLRDAPFLRHVWLTGAASSRPWVTACPSFVDLPDERAISDEVFEAVESEVAPSDRMVIVQTSGATAEPKAVVHTHAAQVRQAWKLAQLYGLTADVRIFSTMPFFWVGGLTVLVLAHLHAGAAIITVERTDSRVMLDLIETARPTRLLGWTLFERLRVDPTYSDRDVSWLADLEVPPVANGRRHGSLGMTETSGPHTVFPTLENLVDLPEAQWGSFGPPIAGMEHVIVDPETGVPVADGGEGEIYVRGESLMEGLHKQERSRTFDPDGWYHTGDRGYFRDGLLFFTGRLTEMIKTGGANVAPREVELAVESLPGVQAAFVVGVPDAERGEVVGCLVCPDEGHELDTASIGAALADVLSSFKIPRRILVVPYDDAPWLGSGKISRPRVVEMLLEPDA